MRDRPRARHAVALAAALAAHAAFLVALAGAGAFLSPRPPQPIAIAPLSAAAWAQHRLIAPTARAPVAAPAEDAAPPAPAVRAPTPPGPEPEGQVVAVSPSQDARRPDRPRFLAERDNRVERETRARVTGQFETPAPRVIAAGPGRGAKAGGELGAAEESHAGAPGPRAQNALPAPAPAEGDAGAAAAPGDGAARRRAALAALRAAAGSGEEGARRAGAYDPRLLPTAAVLGELAGGPSDDALDGVPEGDATLLNTRGWRYAEFMNRVKREVSAAWDPETPLAQHDPDDRRGTWTTSLRVVLDGSGALKRIEVRRPSGREYLDAAAIEAFRRAQPFPNPPRGLVDAGGEIRFGFGLRYRPPGEGGLGAAAASILGPAGDGAGASSPRAAASSAR